MALPTLSLPAPIDGNHTLIVTATFELQQTSGGTDWGGTFYSLLYMIQNSVQTNGDQHPYTTSRLPFTIQYAFSPIAGYAITAGLGVHCGGAGTTATLWNCKLQAELVKR